MAPRSFPSSQDMGTWNRESLLKERTSALEQASNLGRQYNSSLPISKLPLELLLKIFLYHTEPFGYPWKTESYCARVVSQVCHHWRKAALGAPILWSQFIDCKSLPPKWFQVVLRRARSAPLKVNVDPLKNTRNFERGPNFTDANVGLALREVGNIGELNIYCAIEEGIIRPMIKHFQQPAPFLKRLTLSLRYNLPDIDVQFLPATMFSGITGPLQYLSLSNCIIDLQSPLYHHLTYLCITDIPSPIAPSTTQWLDMLSTAPRLTSLQLGSAFSSSGISGSIPHVHLPQLSSLNISGPSTQCIQFLYHIRLGRPAHCSVYIFLLDVDLEDTFSIPNLSVFLQHQVANVEPFRFCTASLSQDFITINNCPSFATMDIENPSFEIELGRESIIPFDSPRLLSLLLTGIARCTPRCEKLTISLTEEQGDSLDEVFKILCRTFSLITYLDIPGMEGSDLILNYLCILDDDQLTHGTDNDGALHTRIRLPNLEDLSVSTEFISTPLINFLQFRKKWGQGIKALHFSSRLQQYSQLEAVKSLCSSISLDGYNFSPLLAPLPLEKEYFNYHGEQTIDPEIEAIVGS